jgi:hypothetical protein
LRKTITICDLQHDEATTATSTVSVSNSEFERQVDVCAEHVGWFGQLGQAATSASTDDVVGEPQSRVRSTSTRPRKRSGARAKPAAASESSGQRRAGSRRALQAERAAVREWARAQGMAVEARGRLPRGLVEDYRQQNASA